MASSDKKKAAPLKTIAPTAKPSSKPSAKPAAKPAPKLAGKSAAKPIGKSAVAPKSPAAKQPTSKAPIGKPALAKADAPKSAPAKVSAKLPAKDSAKAPAQVSGKPVGKAVPEKPVKGSTTAEKSVPVKGGKGAAIPPAPASRIANGAAPAAKSGAIGKSIPPAESKSKADAKAEAKAEAKAAKPASTKGSTKKKGPIDLATAKSVAAVAAASQADSSGYVLINGRRVRMISTKGLPAPKRAKALIEKEVEKPDPQVGSIKTKLTKKELDEYRALLMLKRRHLVGMLSGMEDEALRSSGGNLSTMPLHMADIGTDTFDQDFTLGMAETERALLDEIDAALHRIDNKTYGVCQLTGKPIPKTRLEAKPWAKYSIEAAKMMERGASSR